MTMIMVAGMMITKNSEIWRTEIGNVSLVCVVSGSQLILHLIGVFARNRCYGCFRFFWGNSSAYNLWNSMSFLFMQYLKA
jgi:hypothetical protein